MTLGTDKSPTRRTGARHDMRCAALTGRRDGGCIAAARRGKRPERNELVHKATSSPRAYAQRPPASANSYTPSSLQLSKTASAVRRDPQVGFPVCGLRARLAGQLRATPSRSPPKQGGACGAVRMAHRMAPPPVDTPQNSSACRQLARCGAERAVMKGRPMFQMKYAWPRLKSEPMTEPTLVYIRGIESTMGSGSAVRRLERTPPASASAPRATMERRGRCSRRVRSGT